MTLTCIVIDDEPLAREKLKKFVEQIPYVELKETFSNCIDAVPYLSSESPDFILLDIQMDHMTGIQLLEKVDVKPYVIIVSAFEQYALKGYELNVCDYILKPYGLDRLIQAIEKVRKLKEPVVNTEGKKEKEFIFVKADYRIVKVNIGDIQFVEGMRDYLCIHTETGKILASHTFKELQAMLPANTFIRVHKSFIVNVIFINSIEKHRIYIKENIIPISQTYKDSFYRSIQA